METREAVKVPSPLLASSFSSGCAPQTTSPAPNLSRRAQAEKLAPPPARGFMEAEYALPTPPSEGSNQQAILHYDTGELLAAWAEQCGGSSVKNVYEWRLKTANNVIDFWANGLSKRLQTLGVHRTRTSAASN